VNTAGTIGTSQAPQAHNWLVAFSEFMQPLKAIVLLIIIELQ
jgi:hypothetical protein